MSQKSTQDLAQQMVQVRDQAHQRLARYSRLDPGKCQESFLFEKDRFCGVRFTIGPFRAEWFVRETTMQFFRDANQIGQVEIAQSEGQRAA